MPTNIRDPRTLITPDAFEIDGGLLGLPLAGPWRRFWAMMIDLIVIGVLTVFLDSIQLFVWGVVALFFIRIAFQRPGRASQAAAVLLRVFAGCLGLVILLSVVGTFFFLRTFGDDGPDVSSMVSEVAGELEGIEGLEDLSRLAGLAELDEAETPDEAVDAAVRGLAALDADREMDDDEAVELLLFAAPDEAEWLGDADSLFAVAVERWRSGSDGTEEGAGDAADADVAGADDTLEDERESVRAEVEALSDAEALTAWAALVDEGGAKPDDPVAAARADALRLRAVTVVAGDTLERLEDELDDVGDERDDLESTVRRVRRDLEGEQSGFTALLRDVWDQAGSAIGLWSIYFTVLLTLWHGQTVGKKLLGIRVLRLDGEPMTWWASFERGGGYVAGIATGLLGFAQVFWDPNRQCIHDKIVGTVVVVSGAEPVAGAWEEAHQAVAQTPDAP